MSSSRAEQFIQCQVLIDMAFPMYNLADIGGQGRTYDVTTLYTSKIPA